MARRSRCRLLRRLVLLGAASAGISLFRRKQMEANGRRYGLPSS